jgi:hypothetical protein
MVVVRRRRPVTLVAAGLVVLAGCGTTSAASTATPTSTPPPTVKGVPLIVTCADGSGQGIEDIPGTEWAALGYLKVVG